MAAPSISIEDVLLLMILVVLLATMLIMPKQAVKKKEKKIKTVTLIKCTKCGQQQERDFKKGDFVGKKEGTCTCGGERIVYAIYETNEEKSKAEKT